MKTPSKHLARSNASLSLMIMLMAVSSDISLFAHEDQNTHPALTIGAFLFLDQAAPEDAAYFASSDRALARIGSIEEDFCPNYASHFYDPKTGENLSIVPPKTTHQYRYPGLAHILLIL